MEINIEQRDVRVVSGIEVDGKKYPLHQWNIDRANRYLLDGDKKHLEELKDFSLDM